MRSKNGHPASEFERLVVLETDNCVRWTCGHISTGYGQLTVDGKHELVHRLACERAHGAPPTPDHTDAAHSCRNRDCMNPRHLRWATRSENMADRWRDGTQTAGRTSNLSVLREDDVRSLRQMRRAGVPVKEIAAIFGVHPQTVYSVLSGASWAWLK